MHLLGKGDIDGLKRANPHYNGVISNFLKNETILGNAYIYSAPKQPYTFPCRVLEFNKSNIEGLLPKLEMPKQKSVTQEMQELSAILDRNKTFAAFSRGVYQYFSDLGIDLPFADSANRWIEWEYADNLYKQVASQREQNE